MRVSYSRHRRKHLNGFFFYIVCFDRQENNVLKYIKMHLFKKVSDFGRHVNQRYLFIYLKF